MSTQRALVGAPTFASSWLGFWVLAEKTLRAKLAYRLSLLISLIANALGYVVFFLVWSEVYRGGGNGGLPSERLFPYLVAAFVLNFTLSLSVEVRFGQRLRQGLITSDLLRPLGFMPFQLAQAVGDAACNLVLALPLLALAVSQLGAVLLPGDLLSAVAGVLSVALGFLVNFGVSYLVVQASFVTSSFYGILFTRMALHQVFSGLSAPLVLFPPALQAVAAWLPFRHVIETPALIWLGHTPAAHVPLLLLEQAAWACGMIALSVGLFRAALGRHQVQGG